MAKYDFDIDYHSKAIRKAEMIEAALRNYLAGSINNMSLDDILSIADALNDCAQTKRSQTARLEEYRTLQAELRESEIEAEAAEAIDAEVEPVNEAV